MEIRDDRRYTKTHEWARTEGDLVRVGITAYAAEELGDIVYLELTAVGAQLQQNEAFGVIESVKAAADLYMPVSGEVVDVNAELTEEFDRIGQSPYDEAWMITVKPSDADEADALMDAAAYERHLAEA